MFAEKRALVELRRIANSLEFLALHIARKENIMWNPGNKVTIPLADRGKDEVLHTTDVDMLAEQVKEFQQFMSEGAGND